MQNAHQFSCETLTVNSDRKAGSIGRPNFFVDAQIVDDGNRFLDPNEAGELVLKGPSYCSGYFNDPEATAAAVDERGFFHTGDVAYYDDEGYFYIVDRKKDMIISGGVNVYPRDIEEILATHPAIREVAVFGVPSEKWGETPVAAVVLKQSASASPEAIKNWVNERVEARYQQVSEVVIVDEFPRNVAGKTLKRVMRDQYWQNSETKI